MRPDQIYDKRTIGIPEDVLLIRAQVRELRDQAEELVGRAERIVSEAESAEATRKANEVARQEAEAEREYNYVKMMQRIELVMQQMRDYQRAVDALGSLHSEKDYMLLGRALHTRNGAGECTDGSFKFKAGTYDQEDGMSIAGAFYGMKDTEWQN